MAVLPACIRDHKPFIHRLSLVYQRTCLFSIFSLLACLCYEEFSNKIKNSIYRANTILRNNGEMGGITGIGGMTGIGGIGGYEE